MEESLVRSRKRSPIIRRSLILIAIAILMVASVSAFADQDTFTKWVTTAPSMSRLFGGADGNGRYAGEILKYAEVTATVTSKRSPDGTASPGTLDITRTGGGERP